MIPLHLLPAAATGEAVLRWRSLPPPWVLALVVLPAAAALVWLAYRREDLSPGKRAVLAGLRLVAVLAACLLVFEPYLERTLTREVRPHLLVLLDTSQSMAVADDPDPAGAAALASATGLPADRLRETPRFELARRALLEGGSGSPLSRLRERFVVHLYGFGSEARPAWSADENRPGDDPDGGAAAALAGLAPDGASTHLGDSVVAALEDFRLRDEPVAGVVVLSDGRQTGGTRSPREAGEQARAFAQRIRGAEHGVPVLAVAAGDPSATRNVQVRNLVAPEVVLAQDDAAFEFDALASGFDGQAGVLRIQFLEPRAENATLTPGEVALQPGESGVRVKARYRFTRPGLYRIRVGIPPLPGERVTEDNFLEHQVRVVDRKVKVLYVDGRPRREWESLQRALTRDADAMLVHTLQLESARDVPQPRTDAPGWPALPGNRFPRDRQALFEYDVVVLGDADWRLFDDTPEAALERLRDLRDFVDAGGGLLLLAGEFFLPLEYRRTPLAEVLPVVVDADEVLRAGRGDGTPFNFALTPEGRDSPLFRIEEDAGRSARLWETAERWKSWWYFPPRRAAAGARVLAVHPAGSAAAARGQDGVHGNVHGPHVLAAVRPFGLGRALWIGTDELWRMRYGVGDLYYYAFYAKAVRYLASYRLLGGNRRLKVFPERQVYFLDEPVTVLAHAVGEDFRPPSPLEKPSVRTVVTRPDGTEEALELFPVPQPEGEAPRGVYRGSFTAAKEGSYRVAPDPAEVPGETPEGKAFRVQASAEERKDPTVDEEALRALADASREGRFLRLAELGQAAEPGVLPERGYRVPVETRPEPLSDAWWSPTLLTLLLAAEWLLRKRWRLV